MLFHTGLRRLLALWRSCADAETFASTPERRAAVPSLYHHGWHHRHFSAIWELRHNHGCIVFCPCASAAPVGNRTCSARGEALLDLFRTEVHPA